ncbi:pimeloyl-ACP methyl ester carboxylesterase [Paenibacillus shirakamiensis]|uniref:Pimeloyl-ACP methyl ester carboxylesterase n=1 Tax=Paenibacillus shirakamiensis TaxID=1265935 RepID=A0ABS4JJ20_9BACL|nr:alpha/beta fold hydrolase [Paenibacillus shirakamiensis]MBP2001693.1 pimeloyl-ACP methyl ester carboxylesterase [Paenibacillus shirakamiensis]
MTTDFDVQLPTGRQLHCTHYPCKQDIADSLIIIVHGFKGFKDWGMFPYVAEQFSQHHEVITFNFSHNGIGSSPVDFTELDDFAINTYQLELQDLSALISYTQQVDELKLLPLILIGHSRGAGTSLIYGLDHPRTLAAVLSWNGITRLDLFSDQQKQEMRIHGISYVVNGRTGQAMPLDAVLLQDLELHAEQYDIFSRITHADFAVALIQGTEDHLRVGSAQLTSAHPHIPWIHVEGGNHTFNSVHPFQGASQQLKDAIEVSESFISDVLRKRTPSL